MWWFSQIYCNYDFSFFANKKYNLNDLNDTHTLILPANICLLVGVNVKLTFLFLSNYNPFSIATMKGFTCAVTSWREYILVLTIVTSTLIQGILINTLR